MVNRIRAGGYQPTRKNPIHKVPPKRKAVAWLGDLTDQQKAEIVERYPDGYTTDVSNCARCGGDHSGLEFDPLPRATDDWMFWAMCPVTQAPILGAIAPTPKTEQSMEAWRRKTGKQDDQQKGA